MANNKCIKSRSMYSFVNFMNGIVKPNEQSEACFSYAVARKRARSELFSVSS